jgi:hypothetical protein
MSYIFIFSGIKVAVHISEMKGNFMFEEVIEARRKRIIIFKRLGWDDLILNHSRAKETKIIRKEM